MNRLKVILLFLIFICGSSSSQTIRVGAKHFNESYILGEIFSQLLEANGYKVQRNFNLGGTLVCFESLREGQIDVYPEYTGTISEAILKLTEKTNLSDLNKRLFELHKLEISGSLGFNNTYGLAVKNSTAQK